MKKYTLFSLILLLFVILSCSKKNPFFGVDAEDIQGPSIAVNFPSQAVPQSGTITILGTAQDQGGDNSVLKIEYSLDDGVTWQLANGTSNWSFSLNSYVIYGVTPGNQTLKIKATDTNYKPNTTIISLTYYFDNSNPSLLGAIDDINDGGTFYHKASSAPIHYSTGWPADGGVVQYLVTLYQDGTNIGSVTCNGVGSGLWGTVNVTYDCNPAGSRFFEFTGNSDRTYYITVQQQLTGGIDSGALLYSQQVTNDFSLPVVGAVNFKITLAGVNYGDTSFIASDPVFTWNPAAITDTGSTGVSYLTLDVTGQPTVSIPYNANANSYLMTLPNGTYTAVLKAVDRAGNISSTLAQVSNFTVNKTAPTDALTILRGTGYTAFHNATTLVYQWTNPTADVAGYDIQVIRSDGCVDSYANISAAGASPAGLSCSSAPTLAKAANTTFTFTGTSNYSYSLRVTTYNNSGIRAATSYVSPTIAIDILAPNSITSLKAGGNTTGYTTGTAITLTWAAATDNSISGISHYRVNLNGSSDFNTVGAVTSYNLTGMTLNALNVVTVYAVDNCGFESGGVPINIYSDAQASNAPVILTVNADATNPKYSNTALNNVAIVWSAPTDNPAINGSGVASYQITYDGGTNWYNVSGTSTNYTFGAKLTAYDIRVRAVDNAGNVSTPSASFILHVDNQAPNPPTNLQYAGATTSPRYFNTDQLGIAVSWSAPADIGSSGIAYYQISLDGGTSVDGANIPFGTNSGTRNFTIKGGAPYYYSLTVRAVDNAGNTSAWAAPIIIWNETQNPGQIVSVIGVYNTALYQADLIWLAPLDTGSGVKEYLIEINEDPTGGGVWSGFTAQPVQAGTSFSYSMNGGLWVTNGQIQFRVTARDNCGNTSIVSGITTITRTN